MVKSLSVEQISAALTLYRGPAHVMPSFHTHDGVELDLIQGGGITLLYGEKEVPIPAGALTLLWAPVPHRVIRFDKGAVVNSLTIPLEDFIHGGFPAKITDAILEGQCLIEQLAQPDPWDNFLFERWTADLKAGKLLQQAVLYELQARLYRMSIHPLTQIRFSPLRRTKGLPLGHLHKAEQMARLIARRYREPLQIKDLCRELKINPRYAVRIFQKMWGVTPLSYLHSHRLMHARVLLASTDRKVLDIALDSGFSGLARFYDTFTRSCGTTPLHYRRKLQHHK
ncbi:MAG: helix-turn-helix domain-containing protein [Verrucomicrobiota bacterium]|nr:helix-turn-helix domain-containing protein [Verrucomicrobiota bacterium]